MPTLQPSFWCVANIGDVDPLNHGGAFVLVDRRGNYCPELHILEPIGEDDYGDPTSWELYKVLMENCTLFRDGNGEPVLSDNCHHPTSCAWFADGDDLASLASYIGATVDSLCDLFVGNLLQRATAWKVVHDYHGPQSEPGILNRKEASRLCRRMLRQLKASESWHDGSGATVNKG